jgi:hypothetical protein
MSAQAGLEERAAWFDLRQAMRCKDRESWDAEYMGLLGERVVQTGTPSMAVVVNTVGYGRVTLSLPASDPIHPRIDTVCQRDGTVIQGIPSALPAPPAIPAGYAPLAHIRVLANSTSITAYNISGAGT